MITHRVTETKKTMQVGSLERVLTENEDEFKRHGRYKFSLERGATGTHSRSSMNGLNFRQEEENQYLRSRTPFYSDSTPYA